MNRERLLYSVHPFYSQFFYVHVLFVVSVLFIFYQSTISNGDPVQIVQQSTTNEARIDPQDSLSHELQSASFGEGEGRSFWFWATAILSGYLYVSNLCSKNNYNFTRVWI